MDPQKIWQAVLGELEVTLSAANFTTWFKNTSLEDASSDVALVLVPNAFTKEWLQRKYLADIIATLRKHVPECRRIEFKVGTPAVKAASTNDAPVATSALPSEPDVDHPTSQAEDEKPVARYGGPSHSFGNFIVGNSNRLAYAAALAVTKKPGQTYNPLFLYGGAGLGKTHLLKAIGRQIQDSLGQTVLYTTTEKFTNEFISAIQQNKTAAFKARYRKVDVLLIDDVQFLAGKETMQEEFFHTFNALHGEGKQIVLTSDRPPKAIPTLEERLRSRFEWGMIADVAPPEMETRAAILLAKAEERGYQLPPEVSDYIIKSVQQNIRELEGALIRVMAHCELTGEQPTAVLAERILGSLLSTRRHRQVTTSQIIDAVSRFYDVSLDQIRGPGRQKDVVRPRQLVMYLLREEANMSYPKIGQEIGGRDHTTVIHAVEKIAGLSESDEPLRHELSLIKERLYA